MPPPPPPAPPPIPKLSGGSNKSNSSAAAPDRNALLLQIRKGAHLKKAETNDRSAPLVNGNKNNSNGGSGGFAAKQTTQNKSNGPFPIIPPGGLFAGGIPKLRPTVPKSNNTGASPTVIQSIKNNSLASSIDRLRIGQLGGSRSQPPSPVSKPRLTSGTADSETTSLPCGNPNFPDDLNFKGPAPPPPPPANQKPVFNKTSTEPSNKPTVRRSASQTNLGQRPRVNRPPPNVKPPPPPKMNNTNPVIVVPQQQQPMPPPPPSKPPNIMRRQSFGVGEGARFQSNKLSVAGDSPKPPKLAGPPPPPPPPPRNNSAPNDLNKMGVVPPPPPNSQWNKMNIAPPPPPNRAPPVGNRSAVVRPALPRAPAPPPPPPPPQHLFNNHAQTKSSGNGAPPPPLRVSSMKQSSDFEERFKFQHAQNLPKPERFLNTQKTYPSKANRLRQSTRRQPPPPPPQSGPPDNRSVVHIQLSSGIFNSYAQS